MQAAFSPVIARYSDLTGKKKHIIAVCCCFGVVGAVLGSRATSMTMIIGAQILIGFAISCVGVTSWGKERLRKRQLLNVCVQIHSFRSTTAFEAFVRTGNCPL